MNEPKNRLVQTRVPEKLEATLKDEARRRRTTVSQMIRNVLEDTFDLVDGVVESVDQIVSGSVELAQQVGRDARKIGQLGQDAYQDLTAPCRDSQPASEDRLARVQAWSEVVLNQPTPCTQCGAELPRGSRAFADLSTPGDQPRAWLCARAVASLAAKDETAADENEDS
ncbi:MAG: hypothetical protein VCC00_06960 [Deltaproteobacteria bacterium]